MNLNDLFTEEKVRLDPKCWTGKKIGNPKTKVKGGVRVNNCVPAESVEEGIVEGMSGQVVFRGTGADGGKYEIIQSGPTDFMIHANGKHIDTYGSLQRAMSVLKNEVPGLQQGVAEGSEPDAYGNTGEKHECGSCNGTGIVSYDELAKAAEYDDVCPECGGKGWVRDKESLKKKGVAEAPGAETLGHNQSTVASNLNSLDLDEGWKEKLGAAALAGSMALGSAGAQARVMPGADPSINRLTGKPNIEQPAPSDIKPAVQAPAGYSKEYLQKAADPNRFGRYMISVEKAQELLKNMQGDLDEGDKKPEQPEADYGDDYQDMVARVKKLAGLGPMKTVYDPAKRVYRNVPTAVQPKK